MQIILDYLKKIERAYKSGIATEHTYRPAIKSLLEDLNNSIIASNEPKRIECGAPDFIIQHKNLTVGYIEAKDMKSNLDKIEDTKQLKRYLISLDNLIVTNNLEFRWYVNGEYRMSAVIGKLDKDNQIKINKKGAEDFLELLEGFYSQKPIHIKSAKTLALKMATTARLIYSIILKAIEIDKDSGNTLHDQLRSFRKVLLHNLTEEQFADMYSQTICYGMFAAKMNSNKDDNFNRQNSIYYIPKTNPFLRNLFSHIAGPDLDTRLTWIVDDLTIILNNTNINKVLKDFGAQTSQNDAIIHFYETFLREYDPQLRGSRGVYYTPNPVVSYIVESVDNLLENDFNLDNGLANDDYIKVDKLKIGGTEVTKLPKVQILDPAVGTGTFLHDVIDKIYRRFKDNKGLWPDYIRTHLLPRIHGFEILMAPYTIAHMSIGSQLASTGYSFEDQDRVRVFLTNTIEEATEIEGFTLFSHWLASEVNAANEIKRLSPIMVIVGNPPYSNFGGLNNSDWIKSLLEDYKENLNEKKLNLNDDYIKFIRFSQWKVEQNGQGIVAFITNNSFISGITHRQMRKSLMKTFSQIYILNLHGDISERETYKDDENVFKITRGVSINIFVKKARTRKEFADVYYSDLTGTRSDKYKYLENNNLKSTKWTKLNPEDDTYYFVPITKKHEQEYSSFWSISDIFQMNSSGIQTKKDKLAIAFSKEELSLKIKKLRNSDMESLREELQLGKDSSGWKLTSVINDVQSFGNGAYIDVQYRPFDFRLTYFTGKSGGFIGRPRTNITSQFLHNNLGLATMRQLVGVKDHCQILATKCMLTDRAMKSRNGTPYVYPLFLYPTEEEVKSGLYKKDDFTHNLRFDFLEQVEEKLGVQFRERSGELPDSFDPHHIFYYIYAITNSNSYRERFKEFIKKEYPKVPIISDLTLFQNLCSLGEILTNLHTFQTSVKGSTRFPVQGEDLVEVIKFESLNGNIGKIIINNNQYFDNVNKAVWEHRVGGYQVASQWLKERKNHVLKYDDKVYFIKLLDMLDESLKIINKIDSLIETQGGWPLK